MGEKENIQDSWVVADCLLLLRTFRMSRQDVEEHLRRNRNLGYM